MKNYKAINFDPPKKVKANTLYVLLENTLVEASKIGSRMPRGKRRFT